MTEVEWLACDDPTPMLNCLQNRTWHRKLHLFAAACCRRISELIPEGACQEAVRSVEQYADGHISKGTLYVAGRAARAFLQTTGWHGVTVLGWTVMQRGAQTACAATAPAARAAREALFYAQHAVSLWAIDTGRTPNWKAKDFHEEQARMAERLKQAALLREIVGVHFQRLIFPPSWRTDTTIALASQMYESRDFSAMPILADALQDAGCDSADVLNHCRGEGPHVRGCWVVDLVPGKE